MPENTDQSCSTVTPASIDLRSAPMAPPHEIAAEAPGIDLAHGRPVELDDESLANVAIRHSVEQQIGLVQRLARKEDLRDEAIHPAPAQNRKVDMRRPPPPARFEHRIRSGLDGEKLKLALSIGHQAPLAGEVR